MGASQGRFVAFKDASNLSRHRLLSMTYIDSLLHGVEGTNGRRGHRIF
jgi:hypothetical protein